MKKNKSKTIKFYGQNKKTSDDVKPSPAIKSIPEWYKRQPGKVEQFYDLKTGTAALTVKKCMAVFDSMTAGYYFYAPCDIYINATDPDKLIKSIPQGQDIKNSDLFAEHNRQQYTDYPVDSSRYHKDVIRISSLWSVQTSPGTSTLFLHPLNTNTVPLFAIPGIIDTDNFLSEGFFSFFVEKDFNGVIKKGTPLLQLIPFERGNWTSEFVVGEKADEVQKTQRNKLRAVFYNGYKDMFRAKKDYK